MRYSDQNGGNPGGTEGSDTYEIQAADAERHYIGIRNPPTTCGDPAVATGRCC